MDAPNKIYLLDYQSLGMSYPWYEKPQNIDGIMAKPENVEYIRKEAFVEWIQTELKSCEGAAAMTRAYHKLIEKLSSL
jgi:hypothetical protein